MKSRSTILLFVCAVAGIALGVAFLIFGFKLESPQTTEVQVPPDLDSGFLYDDTNNYGGSDNYDFYASTNEGMSLEDQMAMEFLNRMFNNQSDNTGAVMISKSIYICIGGVLAFVSTSVAAVMAAKMAKEEEENQPK